MTYTVTLFNNKGEPHTITEVTSIRIEARHGKKLKLNKMFKGNAEIAWYEQQDEKQI